jgi:acyl-CoA thioesterase FadM
VRSPIRVRTRWDDADRFGHVNNAAYLALIREATDRAIARPVELAEIEIEFKRALPPNAEVEISVDPESASDPRLAIRYRLAHDGVLCATAAAVWRDRAGPAPPLPALERDAGGRAFAFEHTVRSYEVGPDRALRPVAPLQWFEYAVYRAAERVDWTASRMLESDFVTLQIGHHLALGPHPEVGEHLTVLSRIVELRRVSGAWHHEARRADGSILAADRSRGAFLDLAGRARRPPEDMIAALLRGDPDS